mgnify:CR=1 FL=1
MNLLVAESPLIVLPTLAARIGLEESIFLQQIHFLNTYSNNEKDGFKWVYNTYEEWVSIFPFFKNAGKIKRIVSKLEGLGVLVTTSQYNRLKIDRRKWYRVNYESKLLVYDHKSEMTDGESEMTDGESEMTDGESEMTEQYTENYNRELQQRSNTKNNYIVDETETKPEQEKNSIAEADSFVAAEAATQSPKVGNSKTKSARPTAENKKRFERIVDVYNQVFADCPMVSCVALTKVPNPKDGALEYTKVNQERLKLIPYAWEFAKLRLDGWKDDSGLIDGEQPSSKHVLMWFETYFAECLADGFINGSQPRSKAHENWKADFNYMMKRETLEKRVLEK